MKTRETLIGTHWGNFIITSDGRSVLKVTPSRHDSYPSQIGQVLYDAADPEYRVMRPMVRESYLRGDTDNRRMRGRDEYVAVPWDEALDLAAGALRDTIAHKGNEAIFGGSYGWSSAGRFHHAQSQLHRFLNSVGGYVSSVNTYSAAAAEVILPHVLGADIYAVANNIVDAADIAEHCSLHLAFGGITPQNNQSVAGGIGDHVYGDILRRQQEVGRTRIVNISPNRDDVPAELNPEWLAIRPGTDAALMLALAHEIETSGRVDQAFLDSHTVGYDMLRAYLLGDEDGVPKTPAWAALICGIEVEAIESLARRLCATDTSLVTIALALQRAEHGEQPYWLAIILSAMLGTFGRKGCGVGLAWGSNGVGYHGRRSQRFKWGALPQGKNPVKRFIPVARIADMLLHPGEACTYNGQIITYPEIDLVYWAGGNPFHHHQDLHRLREAFLRPAHVIVNENAWTATAQHADIVFPACTMLERNDIVCGRDTFLTPSQQAIEPVGEARTDYQIFAELAARLGAEETFTEGLDEMGWLRRIHEVSQVSARDAGVELLDFDAFWQAGETIDLADQIPQSELTFEAFRRDPVAHALGTPSGRIEIFSRTIADFGYADCRGLPRWFDKVENLSAEGLHPGAPLHLLSPQPANRLHSQFTFSQHCAMDMRGGREILRINPVDAAARGVGDSDVVRVYNDRGACLAAAHVTEAVMPGVVTLPTGAWFKAAGWGREGLEQSGNPNAVTRDIGTSSLAQGPSAQSCIVNVALHQTV